MSQFQEQWNPATRSALRQAATWLHEPGQLLILTGAGVSVDSGLPTYRGTGGLWNSGTHSESDVSAERWERDPEGVWDTLTQTFARLPNASCSDSHLQLGRLICTLRQRGWTVTLCTQNIDSLHEQAREELRRTEGCDPGEVLHLHGRAGWRSEQNPDLRGPMLSRDELRTPAPDGARRRPDIVLFGEDLDPSFAEASHAAIGSTAVMAVGTSLGVYPAANLFYRPAFLSVPAIIFDPALPERARRLSREHCAWINPGEGSGKLGQALAALNEQLGSRTA